MMKKNNNNNNNNKNNNNNNNMSKTEQSLKEGFRMYLVKRFLYKYSILYSAVCAILD